MKRIVYSFPLQKRASTVMALAISESEAADVLIQKQLYREAVVHLYFACFYLSQAFLVDVLPKNTNHKQVETQLHKRYGKRSPFPRQYVKLHSRLHAARITFDYQTTHSPNPAELNKELRLVSRYIAFAKKSICQIKVSDLLFGLHEEHKDKIRDFSFDIYCPKTYSHHTRITFWQPPFYLKIFSLGNLAEQSKALLKKLKVRKSGEYVVGLNSRLNQYQDDHLLMLDMDALNPSIETALKPIGGILLKTGRGFHFIGKTVIEGQKAWRKEMRKLARDKILKKHIDMDHISISLRRGYATLRITSSPVKPTAPYFYKEI